MTRHRPAIAPFLVTTLILSLSASSLCEVARADDRGPYQSIRFKSVTFAPIGRVFAVGGLHINGRSLYGDQTIWAGDLLEAGEATTRIVLDSIGEILLERLAKLRLASSLASADAQPSERTLVASLISGSISVRLDLGAKAYIEAGGSGFAATAGANFRVGIHDGELVVEASNGEVFATGLQPLAAKGYLLSAGAGSSTTAFAPNNKIKVRPNRAVPIRVRMEDQKTKTFLTAGYLFRFLLHTAGVGNFNSQEVTVATDDRGVATAIFTAEPKEGETKVTVQDLRYANAEPSWEGTIQVKRLFGTREKLLVGAAALGIILLVCKCPRPHDKGPIRQEPPPTIP